MGSHVVTGHPTDEHAPASTQPDKSAGTRFTYPEG